MTGDFGSARAAKEFLISQRKELPRQPFIDLLRAVGTGLALTVVGPFAINVSFHAKAGSSVLGTNVSSGQYFNGNPDANIAYGITYLKYLNSKFGNNAPGLYVGAFTKEGLPNPGPVAREQYWNQNFASLTKLFSNTDCFSHQ